MIIPRASLQFDRETRMRFRGSPEVAVIFQSFGRREIARKSLSSLMNAVSSYSATVIVADSTPANEFDGSLIEINPDEYVWAPGDISASTSRNLAHTLLMDKYSPNWLIFVEDDLLYDPNWISELVEFGSSAEGKMSPLGLAYGVFSAAPQAHKKDESVVYDDENDCFASTFGLRADQRMFSTGMYAAVGRFWDPDLLGISSAQTGKINHRFLMRGYCGASIGHRKLCSVIDGQQSTHVGKRDIGPAAFDKRLDGYSAVFSKAREWGAEEAEAEKRGEDIEGAASVRAATSGPKVGVLQSYVKISPPPQVPMSSISFDKSVKFASLNKTFKTGVNALRDRFKRFQ